MFKTTLKLIPAILLFFTSLAVKAQTTNIGIGAEFGLPSGNFSGLSAIGLGLSAKVDFSVSDKIGFSLNGGFMNFFGRSNRLINAQDLTYIPLKGGLKYKFSDSFYAEGQLGAALPLNDGQKTLFVWSPGLGNLFNLSGKNKIDLGIRYEVWTGKNQNMPNLNFSNSKGFVGVRIAYIF
jgi:hypothetical protein